MACPLQAGLLAWPVLLTPADNQSRLTLPAAAIPPVPMAEDFTAFDHPMFPHIAARSAADPAVGGLMQPQSPLGLLNPLYDPLRQTRRGSQLALGEACTSDSQCTTHVCRCPETYRRRPEFCTETGKVCTELLPVGAECDDSRKCISRKCYCAKDPWNREICSYGSGGAQMRGLRKCCFWSWGYWECEGAAMVEDSEERKAQLSHDTPQGFVPHPLERLASSVS